MSVDKVARIFQYLLAVRNLNEKVIRNINEYDTVWWVDDLPKYEGLYIAGSGINEEAWLEVHKQEIPSPPKPPKILNGWVEKFENLKQKPEVKERILIGKDDEGQDIYHFFDEDPDRIEKYRQWMNEWSNWAKEASLKEKIQKIYMELFSIYQRFQREGEDLEIACGHGLLQWEVEKYQISRHVLVTRLELFFDAKKGIFSLIPTSKGTLMETDMLLNIDLPNATRLMQMSNEVEDFDFSPLNKEALKPFLKEIVHTISPDGSFREEKLDVFKGNTALSISYSPCFFLRNTGGRLWQQELLSAIKKIKEGYPVPKTINVLTTNENEGENNKQTDASNESWNTIGEQLLFPLPTNKEQQLIAQKIANNHGVVIQGPPGTGKSHTIANLICHLLAHGKKVLVTSEKERALQVLRNKIPEDIRSLCVSVLGGDSQSVKEIEESIRNIAENLDSKQTEILRQNIERLQTELKTTKRKIAQIDSLINQAAVNENKIEKFGNLDFTPLDAAKWLENNKEHSWLPDSIKPHVQFPLTQAELKRFFELLGMLSKDDIYSLSLDRPVSEKLVHPSLFSQKIDDLLEKEEKVKQTNATIKSWSIKDNLDIDFNDWINDTKEMIEKLNQIQKEKWLNEIIEECSKYPEQVEHWRHLNLEFNESIDQIQQLEKDLIEYTFLLPTEKNLQEVREDLLMLKEKFTTTTKLSWYYKNISGRKIKYLFNEVKINEIPLRSAEDVHLVLKKINLKISKQKLSIKWNRIMNEIDGPPLKENQQRFVFYMKV